MKRNLYYFICPLQGEVWRWNVRRLGDHWDAFNHRKLVVIATGEGLAPPDEVMGCFHDPALRFMTTPNDPTLRQTASFLTGLEFLQSESPDEATFYGHAKGASHWDRTLLNVLRWTDAMYVMNLSSPSLVEALLLRHPSVGCFRQSMPHAGSSWHFSGTFFWFRHDAVFRRAWRSIQMSPHGVESWLGTHLREDESFELTPAVHQRKLNEDAPAPHEYTGWLTALSARQGMVAVK